MRDVNPRRGERFELSLDGRQVASIAVGAIVLLGVVFVLGLNVGKQAARREPRPAATGDALQALDQAPTAAPVVRDESLTYHDRLVKERPAAPPAEPPRPAPAPQPPVAAPTPPPPPAPAAAEPAPAEPVPASASASTPAESASAGPAPERKGGTGDWAIQLGAATDRAEADRIAARYARYAPRIETATVQGKTWHRVRVGAYPTKGAAEKFLKDLSRETGAKGFVTNAR